MKKNEAIKQFVNNTLIEKVGETRTVTKILEEMSEKYNRNMGEKTSEMMRKKVVKDLNLMRVFIR